MTTARPSHYERAPAHIPRGHLEVYGGQDQEISRIIDGEYEPVGVHCGLVLYKRKGQGFPSSYLFCKRDNTDPLRGWLFAPSVYGKHAWAFNPDTLERHPPPDGWFAPADSPHEDETLRIAGQMNWNSAKTPSRSRSRGTEDRAPDTQATHREDRKGNPEHQEHQDRASEPTPHTPRDGSPKRDKTSLKLEAPPRPPSAQIPRRR